MITERSAEAAVGDKERSFGSLAAAATMLLITVWGRGVEARRESSAREGQRRELGEALSEDQRRRTWRDRTRQSVVTLLPLTSG